MSSELLASRRMMAIVEEISERYANRLIIFDSPPLLATSEPVMLARHAGQIVLVVEADKTSRTTVRAALDMLGARQNVSLILNKNRLSLGSDEFGTYYSKYYG